MTNLQGFPGGASGKEPPCQCKRHKRRGFNLWAGKIPWKRAWQPTPVFLPGESHGQKSLAGYSPWGHNELDTTEQLSKQSDRNFRVLCQTKNQNASYSPGAMLCIIGVHRAYISGGTIFWRQLL